MLISRLTFATPVVAIVLTTAVALPTPAVELKVGTFNIDVTPPVGSPLCLGLVPPAAGSADPLWARGIVLSPAGDKPVVLVAVDWVNIGETAHDAWRQAVAASCDTDVERVAVHVLHQHDAPGCDFLAEQFASEAGLAGELFDAEFARDVIRRCAAAAAEALATAQGATHLGVGVGQVREVASNRRVLGPDGKVQFQRMSSTADPKLRELPEGTIDPWVRVVSFWQNKRPLAVLSFYATHPQSYYRTGQTSADFVGVARDLREAAVPQARHIHFNGASGNVAAGKYNDGSPPMRQELGRRLAAGMEAAWHATEKTPLNDIEFNWAVERDALPPADWLDREALQTALHDPRKPKLERLQCARRLAYLQRSQSGHQISFARLRLGPVDSLFFPGEMFVEYQLAAARLRPDRVVCFAAYGDMGPGYIGLAESYRQGGYEVGPVSRVSPRAESVLMRVIGELLE